MNTRRNRPVDRHNNKLRWRNDIDLRCCQWQGTFGSYDIAHVAKTCILSRAPPLMSDFQARRIE